MFTILLYVAALVAANLSVSHWGPSVAAINAFLLIGLDLSLRDKLHDQFKVEGRGNPFTSMLILIGAAGVISFVLNPASGTIAVASVIAFVVAGVVDMIVYEALISKPYLVRSNASNVFGAAADSLIFPTIAFGGLMPSIVAMQFGAKVAGAALWAYVIYRVVAKRAAAR